MKYTLPLLLLLATPAHALPMCYWQDGDVVIDLSHMCGAELPSPAAAVELPEVVAGPLIVARPSQFTNQQWIDGEYVETRTIRGRIYNYSRLTVEDIEIEVTASAPGHSAQRRRTTIRELTGRNNVEVELEFPFVPDLGSVEVEILSYE